MSPQGEKPPLLPGRLQRVIGIRKDIGRFEGVMYVSRGLGAFRLLGFWVWELLFRHVKC